MGTNPRIRVQRDDAFVLWDDIPFDDATPGMSPEWVRRTICCARWESEHASEVTNTPSPRIVLAVVNPPAAEAPLEAGVSPISASPVPLPAPQPNRFESRLAGALAARWAAKAGVEVIELSSAPPQPTGGPTSSDPQAKGRRSGDGPGNRRSGEEDRAKRAQAGGGGGGRGRRNSRGAPPGAGSRPPPQMPPQGTANTGLVERPQAVMTMMERATQPNRVVRVLARGEKLDP